jgi:hypothetical protein
MKMKDWKIETDDGCGKMVFLTSAKTVKTALGRLISHSFDFATVNNEKIVKIKITPLKEKK